MLSLLIQVGLGLGSWVTKLGLPSMGWVASANSPAQNVICTLHTVGGMFLLAATTTAATRVIMLARRRTARLPSRCYLRSDSFITAGRSRMSFVPAADQAGNGLIEEFPQSTSSRFIHSGGLTFG